MTNEIRTTYTRESIADAIRTMAIVFVRTSSKLAASAKLEEIESVAVERFGYTYEEVEAIEIEAYAAA